MRVAVSGIPMLSHRNRGRVADAVSGKQIFHTFDRTGRAAMRVITPKQDRHSGHRKRSKRGNVSEQSLGERWKIGTNEPINNGKRSTTRNEY